MAYDRALADWVIEALEDLGPVSVRRLFSGGGLYLDGAIFAILSQDDLWFKADAQTDAAWDAIAPERLTVTARCGRSMTIDYRRAPADAHDDPEALRRHAALALDAGRRTN
jgi:DNA transformation protein